MIKLLIGTLLVLTSANALAGNMYIKKSTEGQVLLTNVNPSGNFNSFTKKVKVTYYRDGKAIKSEQNKADSKEQNVSYGSSSNLNGASYGESAYLALR